MKFENIEKYCTIKAIVFDLDGTLIDTMRYFGMVASDVINKYYGIEKEKAKKMYFETSGIPFFQQLEVLFPKDERNDLAAKEYEENKLYYFFKEPFSNDILQTLEEIKRRFPNFILAVSSNNFEELVKKYMADNKVFVFDEILGFREGFSKGKDHFEYIMRKYDLERKNIVFIGDSWWDAKVALDNGIEFIAITRTFPKEEWKEKFPNVLVLESFDEILDLLRGVEECRQW